MLPQIDPEFKNLIPPQSEDELIQLEQNILAARKCRDTIILWDGVIIDGHNRFEIAEKYGIKSYAIHEMDFADEDAAKVWIIDNQLGRRNLPHFVRAELAKTREPLIREKAKERMTEGRNQYSPPQISA